MSLFPVGKIRKKGRTLEKVSFYDTETGNVVFVNKSDISSRTDIKCLRFYKNRFRVYNGKFSLPDLHNNSRCSKELDYVVIKVTITNTRTDYTLVNKDGELILINEETMKRFIKEKNIAGAYIRNNKIVICNPVEYKITG